MRALAFAVLLGVAASPRLQAAEERVPVVDLHVDLPYRSGYKDTPFAEGSGEFRASDLERGGLSGVVLPLFVPRDATPNGRTRAEFEASYTRVFSGILATRPYSLPGCGVKRAAGEARSVTTWLSFEGAEPLEPTEKEVDRWILRGVRLFGLVHAQHNVLATSSGEAATGKGLSARGEKLARLVATRGGILDVSHASDEATDDLLRLGRELGRPVVASHSNARALAAHPRNLTDDQIRAIAASGGVVGVNFHQRFLAPNGRQATLDDVVEQVLHLIRIGGVGVVAIGSDYEGGIRAARGLTNASLYPELARALEARGLSRADVKRALGENALRVLCGGAAR